MLYAKWKTVYNAAPSPDGSGTDVQQGDAPAATALTDTKDGDRSSVAAAGTDGQQFPVLLVVLLVVVAAAVICIAVAVVQRKKKTK